MVSHSKWGDPRGCQIAAVASNITVERVIEVPEVRFWSIVLRRAGTKKIVLRDQVLSTGKGDAVPDDIGAERTFRYRCGLIKVVNVLSGTKSTMTVYLDGFENTVINTGDTTFRFDPAVGDDPLAEIVYGGFATRDGGFQFGCHMKIAFIFRDRAQMREFVVATTTASDKVKKVVRRTSDDSGCHDGGDSSMVWPLVAGVLIGACLGDE